MIGGSGESAFSSAQSGNTFGDIGGPSAGLWALLLVVALAVLLIRSEK